MADRSQRFAVYADGKWQGCSFASEEKAKQMAESYRRNPDQKLEVKPRGGSKLAEPEPPKAPASAPSRK